MAYKWKIISYEIQYNEGTTFTPGTPAPAGVQTFTFTSFPASITGLSVAIDYYFTIRSICASDTGSWYDNGSNGPDLWTTSADCPTSLPYFNDFETDVLKKFEHLIEIENFGNK